jgi:hypothetical protein
MTTAIDVPWNKMVKSYFPQCLEFFFPKIHAEIAWERGFEFLESELQQSLNNSDKIKDLTSNLVKVFSSKEPKKFIRLHIAIQNQYHPDFAECMYLRHTRFSTAKWPLEPVASAAIIGDPNPTWQPNSFEREAMGQKVSFYMPTAKILEYSEKARELKKNPFSVVVTAHLSAQQAPADQQKQKTMLT